MGAAVNFPLMRLYGLWRWRRNDVFWRRWHSGTCRVLPRCDTLLSREGGFTAYCNYLPATFTWAWQEEDAVLFCVQ